MIETAKELLKNYFGYDEFRKGQQEIISHILNKEDCLGIMPTGAGKSICDQNPALVFERNHCSNLTSYLINEGSGGLFISKWNFSHIYK